MPIASWLHSLQLRQSYPRMHLWKTMKSTRNSWCTRLSRLVVSLNNQLTVAWLDFHQLTIRTNIPSSNSSLATPTMTTASRSTSVSLSATTWASPKGSPRVPSRSSPTPFCSICFTTCLTTEHSSAPQSSSNLRAGFMWRTRCDGSRWSLTTRLCDSILRSGARSHLWIELSGHYSDWFNIRTFINMGRKRGPGHLLIVAKIKRDDGLLVGAFKILYDQVISKVDAW